MLDDKQIVYCSTCGKDTTEEYWGTPGARPECDDCFSLHFNAAVEDIDE